MSRWCLFCPTLVEAIWNYKLYCTLGTRFIYLLWSNNRLSQVTRPVPMAIWNNLATAFSSINVLIFIFVTNIEMCCFHLNTALHLEAVGSNSHQHCCIGNMYLNFHYIFLLWFSSLCMSLYKWRRNPQTTCHLCRFITI